MRRLFEIALVAIIVSTLSLWRQVTAPQATAASRQQAAAGAPDELKDFAALDPIDTHAHVFKGDPAVYALLERLRLHMLNIVVFEDHDPIYQKLQPKLDAALAVTRGGPGHMAWATTFDPYKFRAPSFAAEAVRQLDRDFAQGAVAVKIWKNIGMEIKTPDGKYVMPDDPVFEPIYRDIAARHKTLIAHVAEPTSCWQPPNPASLDYGYYKQNPEWFMYLHPDHPSKQSLLQARDHLLAENPKLRVVGAHLGSMEVDVDEIARHFDHYPNFAVDTAARVGYLMLQPRDKVRAFLIKYQDRVLYGTDLGLDPGQDADGLQDWQSVYRRDWKFFATNETVEVKGRKVQGLELPEPVLRKVYHDNAVRWFPGIVAGADAP